MQCDQMLESKLIQVFQYWPKKVIKVVVYYIVTYFKIAQKLSKYLDHVDEIICFQELSKIAQSGHTVLEHDFHIH